MTRKRATILRLATYWLGTTSALALLGTACSDPTQAIGADTPAREAEASESIESASGSHRPDTGESTLSSRFREGRTIFRNETFGDEAFWGGKLGLHRAIAGEANGGVGAGVSPATALALGLRVDSEALPRALQRSLRRGEVNLDDPAVTVALLKLNAVVGLTGVFDADGQVQSLGIQCALCHSTVDDSFAPGFGRRL